ncbi:hypothetical protein GWI33_009247 [Rhynchophorus ferrugineus]|uniref:Uncharacterized protein n=1 Tax=Rhynchophorus ferrugineus TaxID=354439 RepID=A0A834MDN9_RHYFE|nr:hypothetical protein GWI33_009247 [Rhynchophorus ferrugineus]
MRPITIPVIQGIQLINTAGATPVSLMRSTRPKKGKSRIQTKEVPRNMIQSLNRRPATRKGFEQTGEGRGGKGTSEEPFAVYVCICGRGQNGDVSGKASEENYSNNLWMGADELSYTRQRWYYVRETMD